MPWNMDDYPESLKNFDHTLKKKIIDIANGLLANGYDEDEAIPIAINQGKEWQDNASEDEVQSFKYDSQPKKSDKHDTSSGNPDLLDEDVLLYFEEGKWQVRSKKAKQAANHFDNKEDALKRAKEIANNKDSQVISYTKDGKKET